MPATLSPAPPRTCRPEPTGLPLLSPAIPQTGAHIPALDGLRGAAILLVMLLHFGGSETDPGLARTALPALGRAYLWVADNGACGVDLFFVLSGFLITGILFDARQSPHYFRNFYARRALRIFPLYYGVLLALLLPRHLLGAAEPADEWGLWLYCTNFVMAVRDQAVFNTEWLHLSHFWSLAVEEHFYFVWPVIVFACSRRTSMRICVACGVAALALRAGLLGLGASGSASYLLTPCRMDALTLGAFLALAARGADGPRSLVRWGWGLLVLSGAVAGTAAVLRQPAQTAVYAPALKYSIYALFFGGVLALTVSAARTGVVGRFWSSPVLTFFGKYSYGLYVFHYALRPLCGRLFPADELSALLGSRLLGVMVHAALAVALSMAVAWLSWHLFEKHFLKLKRYFTYSATASPR
jgi:peptidoglycan/LPS O-acetylase OafA/YrhL